MCALLYVTITNELNKKKQIKSVDKSGRYFLEVIVKYVKGKRIKVHLKSDKILKSITKKYLCVQLFIVKLLKKKKTKTYLQFHFSFLDAHIF